MIVKVTGADLFSALQNSNGEDVWYLVDEYFSHKGETNPYECPITEGMTIETEHFKQIVDGSAKVKKIASADLGEITHTQVQQLVESDYGIAVQQIVSASASQLQEYLAENAYALGITATEIYAAVLEQTIVNGVGNATNTVLKRLSESLEEVSRDTSEDFLGKYGITSKVEVAPGDNTASTHLLTKRFNQFKAQA